MTANLHDTQGVSAAYARAVRHSRSRRVIVERHVAGDDFRLMVTGGRFEWAIRRRPPEVTGDGASTITELVARANTAIDHDRIEQGYAKPVTIDDEVRRSLAAAGCTLEDRPPAGYIVRLGSNANVSTGGSFMDVSDIIHPDNRMMAETIARAFRLDSVGIDFRHGYRALMAECALRCYRSQRDAHALQRRSCAAPARQQFPGRRQRPHSVRADTLRHAGRPARIIRHARAAIGEYRHRGAHRSAPEWRKAPPRPEHRRGCGRGRTGAESRVRFADGLCTLNELRRDGLQLTGSIVACIRTTAPPDRELRAVLNAACGKIIATSGGALADALRGVLR